MRSGWTEFLEHPDRERGHVHAVQVYGDVDDLVESVALYLGSGLAAGEPALLVASAEHRPLYLRRLDERGCDTRALIAAGLLRVEDAGEMLSAIMAEGRPSATAFEDVVGGCIDELAERFPGPAPRVFGEMVDILCARGEAAAAHSLEDLWNSLAHSRAFSLLCGYELDVFDPATQAGTLSAVCTTHSRVRAAADPARFALAVDQALEDVLGADGAGKVYVVVGEQDRDERTPTAQQVLMWVSANMPALAERILASARARYHAAPVALEA
jgi:DcmR-like sensory protein